LIELVDTEWFVYLHADVYLPEQWFDTMIRYRSQFDWFECNRRKTVLLDYLDTVQNASDRPFSGSQMGRKAVFEPFLSQIDDDYLYRNEDLVLRDMVERYGGRYGRITDTFHYHQIMNKHGLLEPDIERVKITRKQDINWAKRTADMQIRGIVKYTQPDKRYLVGSLRGSSRLLQRYGALNLKELYTWTTKTNPRWLPYVRGTAIKMHTVGQELKIIWQSLVRITQVVLTCPGKHKQ
jgi:hypothetical protein